MYLFDRRLPISHCRWLGLAECAERLNTASPLPGSAVLDPVADKRHPPGGTCGSIRQPRAFRRADPFQPRPNPDLTSFYHQKPLIFLAFCYILLYEADSDAILLRILLCHTNFPPFLLLILRYEADFASILLANLPYESHFALILITFCCTLLYEADSDALLLLI